MNELMSEVKTMKSSPRYIPSRQALRRRTGHKITNTNSNSSIQEKEASPPITDIRTQRKKDKE